MAIEKTLEIKVDSKQAEKNLKEINTTIDEQRAILVLLEDEYIKAKKALDDYNKSGKKNLAQEKQLKQVISERKDAIIDQKQALKQFRVEQRAATATLEEANKGQKDQTNIIRALDKLTGGYASKIIKLKKGLISGYGAVKNFITGLSGVKKALIGTGIGALVVALASVVAYWDEIIALFDSGTKALKEQEQQHRNILATTEQELSVVENQQKILELQGKDTTFIKEEKKKLLKVQMQENDLLLENLQSQLGILKAESEKWKLIRNREKENEAIAEVEDKINKAILNRQKLEINLLNIEKKANDEKQKQADDEKKKIADINKKRKEDKEKADKEEEEAEKRKKDALEKIRQGEIDTEEERRAEERRKIQEHYAELLKLAELYGQDTTALKEAQTTKEKELQDKFDKEDLDRKNKKKQEDDADLLEEQERKITQLQLDKEFDNLTFEEQREILKQREELLLADTVLNNEQKLKLENELSNAKVKLAEAESQAKSKTLGDTENALTQLGEIAGKETAAGKALSIASATINTYRGVSDALAAKTVTPFETALKFINAASILSSGIQNVKKIAAVKVPTASGGGASSGGAGGSVSQPPQFNIVGATETSQLAEAVAGQTQEPVQAYVVANDVTTAQSLQNNIVEGSTL